MKTFLELYDELKEKSKGVYYYMNLRKKKGISRPKGHPKAPSEDDLKRAAQTAKEDHTAVHGTNQDQAKEREKLERDVERRKAQMKRDHENQDRRAIQQDADRKERQIQREAPSLAVLKKKIKSGTKLGSTETASAKARGLIPRADGTKRKSPKYK